MFARILLPIWLISWIILLPLTSADTSVANHSGLDRFIFGNVARNKQSRYWAHLILTYIFTSKFVVWSMECILLSDVHHSMDILEHKARNASFRRRSATLAH